jgi:hypothetical protein
MYSNQPLKMPRLSHNKGKIRNKRRQRLHQRVAAKAPANEEAFDAQESLEDQQDMITPQKLAAIIIALASQETLDVQEDSVTVQDLDLFGAEPDELFTY